MTDFVAECDVCGVLERGDLEDVDDAVEDHEQFHDVQVKRVATDGGKCADGTERYADWKSQIRSELEALEGEGPPSIDELWSIVQHESESAASWIHDMPCTEQEIQTAKGDVLKALVALEMAEDRLSEVNDPDHKPASTLRDDESVLGGDFEI